MRITTFDHDEHKICGIEGRLRRLAALAKPLEAAAWHKLLELIAHVEASGPEHQVWGQIMIDELLLRKREPPDPIREREMKKFMDEWRALNPDSTTWKNRLSREMRRRFPPTAQVAGSVRVDWQDYGPLRGGLPEMHYRLQVKRPGKTISEDARAKEPAEAERIICGAFGW